jgi:hypothetical protein
LTNNLIEKQNYCNYNFETKLNEKLNKEIIENNSKNVEYYHILKNIDKCPNEINIRF